MLQYLIFKFVEVYGFISSSSALFFGVPLPQFFSMLLSERIHHPKFHFYVNDLQLYLLGDHDDLDGLIARVNEDLREHCSMVDEK
jgi:hypothetical protein